jgi:hypothetical protein
VAALRTSRTAALEAVPALPSVGVAAHPASGSIVALYSRRYQAPEQSVPVWVVPWAIAAVEPTDVPPALRNDEVVSNVASLSTPMMPRAMSSADQSNVAPVACGTV